MMLATMMFATVLLSASFVSQAYAHETVSVEQYDIEVGWGTEPPVVGIRNNIVLKVTESSETANTFVGVKDAFRNLETMAIFGGITKNIDINSDSRLGYYYSPIIPTKTGSYEIGIKGELNGTPVDVQVAIEDVESTAILDFPPTGGTSNQDIAALKNAITSIQRDVSDIQSGSGIKVADSGASYDLAVLGLSIASAAIILAVISLVKRK
ncbi:MAG: hypothetical protein OXC46_03775 [Thaumarchaeota archaeon]|nr:hypothetical protein [Nitrososphaerota archaeon]